MGSATYSETAIPPFSRRETGRAPSLLMMAFVVLTAGCVALGAAGVLRMAYPAVGLAVAVFLFAKSKPAYVSFTCWMWFLSPLVRRLADYRGGWQETSTILLAPYLVTAVSGLILFTNLRSVARARSIPFVFAFAAILYGTVVGLTKYSFVQMVPSILNWIVPVCFGFFLLESHDEYAEIQRSFLSTFLIATLVMGAYGIYQFFFLPPWDELWLANVKTTTFGVAEPMQLRGFSTMNAPVIFALTMMATLLVVLGLKSKFRLIAGTVGFISLILSFNRSAWLGFVAGTLFILWKLGSRERMRILTAFIVCALLSPAVFVVPGVKDLIAEKMETMAQPQQDVSYQARMEGYESAFTTLAHEPFGEGVGSPDIDHKTMENDDAIGPHDSLFLELLYSLGWCGTAFYLAALALMIWSAFTHFDTDHPFENAMKAVLVAFFAQCLLNDIVYGGVGFFLWSAGALQLAAIARGESVRREENAHSSAEEQFAQQFIMHHEAGL